MNSLLYIGGNRVIRRSLLYKCHTDHHVLLPYFNLLNDCPIYSDISNLAGIMKAKFIKKIWKFKAKLICLGLWVVTGKQTPYNS